MLYFPRPYPDEVSGSVLARAVIHLGLPAGRLLRIVMGRLGGNLSYFLPFPLRPLASAMRLDEEEVLWMHTSFPYVVAFMTSDEVARIRSKALRPAADARPCCLGSLTKSVTHGLSRLRYCPSCVAADVSTYGESYWHRSHLLPAVHVCALHQTVLCNAAPSRRAMYAGLPPGTPGDFELLEVSPEKMLLLAERSNTLLQRVGTAGHNEDLLATYQQLALASGYVISSGQVAGAQLGVDLRRYYGTALLSAAGCYIRVDGGWPMLMVRPRIGVPFAPVKHVLLRTFLDASPGGQKTVSYERPGKKQRDYGRADAVCADALRERIMVAQRKNVRLTVEELMVGTGYWSAFRHNRERFPQSRAIVAAFRASEHSQRQLGKRPRWRKKRNGRSTIGEPCEDTAKVGPST